MRRRRISSLLGLSLAAGILSGCVSPSLVIGAMPPGISCIAVLPFEMPFEPASTDEMLSEFIALDLFRQGARGVLGPREARSLLQAANDPLPPGINTYWARKFGQKLSVDGVVFGTITRIPLVGGSGPADEQTYLNVDAYLLDVKTGEIRWTFGSRSRVPSEKYVAELGNYAAGISDGLLRSRTSRDPFGKTGCWSQPPSLSSQLPTVSQKTPEKLPPPKLTQAQERILSRLVSGGGWIVEASAFEERTEQITKPGVANLHDLKAVLESDRSPARIQIASHLDDGTDGAEDLRLTKLRAEAVKNYLVSLGIESSRLEATGYGSTKPLLPNINRRSRLQNRRVEITALPAKP